jgi:hypothetical protein
VLDRGGSVSQPQLVILQLGQEHEIVPPRDLSNKLLDDFLLSPCLGERAHLHEVGPGETAQVREYRAQVMSQALDDLAAPPQLSLAVEDIPADLPVEPEQLGIDRQRSTLLSGVDTDLEVGQPVRLTFRRVSERGHLP